MPSSRGSSRSRDRNRVHSSPALADTFFTTSAVCEALLSLLLLLSHVSRIQLCATP